MDGRDLNSLIGLVIISVGFVSWGYVFVMDPHRSVKASFFLLLSFGMLLVSANSLMREPWIAGVIAAVNRIIVAGLGVREARLVHKGVRVARRER